MHTHVHTNVWSCLWPLVNAYILDGHFLATIVFIIVRKIAGGVWVIIQWAMISYNYKLNFWTTLPRCIQ